jgi:hypothetical protein
MVLQWKLLNVINGIVITSFEKVSQNYDQTIFAGHNKAQIRLGGLFSFENTSQFIYKIIKHCLASQKNSVGQFGPWALGQNWFIKSV